MRLAFWSILLTVAFGCNEPTNSGNKKKAIIHLPDSAQKAVNQTDFDKSCVYDINGFDLLYKFQPRDAEEYRLDTVLHHFEGKLSNGFKFSGEYHACESWGFHAVFTSQIANYQVSKVVLAQLFSPLQTTPDRDRFNTVLNSFFKELEFLEAKEYVLEEERGQFYLKIINKAESTEIRMDCTTYY